VVARSAEKRGLWWTSETGIDGQNPADLNELNLPAGEPAVRTGLAWRRY
jgi:hypothetical protein